MRFVAQLVLSRFRDRVSNASEEAGDRITKFGKHFTHADYRLHGGHTSILANLIGSGRSGGEERFRPSAI